MTRAPLRFLLVVLLLWVGVRAASTTPAAQPPTKVKASTRTPFSHVGL